MSKLQVKIYSPPAPNHSFDPTGPMMWVKSTMSQSLEITNGSITDSMLMECQKIKVSLITAWILLNHILTERVLLIVHRRESDYRSSSRRLGLDGNEFFSWNGHMWHTTPNNSIQKQHVEIIVEAHQQSSRGKITCLNWTHRAYFNRLYLECQSRVEWYHPSWSYEMTFWLLHAYFLKVGKSKVV